MASLKDSLVSKRNLLRLGALTGLATALSPVLRLGKAHSADTAAIPTPTPTPTPVFCNADRPTTPADALNALIAGNQLWATLNQVHPGEDAGRRTCVAENGQTPFAGIISCSDSRVPPELVFDQGIGDLFVARVAGNGATGKLAESLYYGTAILGTLVIFVLGHSDCGAVKEAVAEYPKHSLEFVKLIFPAVKRARRMVKESGGNPNDPTQVVPIATNQNVILTVQALRKSPLFKKMVSDGKLLIAGGVYDLNTQQVNILIQ
jgi:carbonic anhydrase